MPNVQLTGSKTCDSKIMMYSCTENNDVSLDKQFKKNLRSIVNMKTLIRKNTEKEPIEENGKT